MLMSVVCCRLTSIIGRRQLSICQLGGCRKPKNWKWYNLLAPFFYSICSTSVDTHKQIEMDAKILGERLRQIRKRLGITQKQLAEATNLTQSAMSRLENGEEIYASALLAILYYYQGKISLDYLFAPDFDADSDRLLSSYRDGELQSFRRQLDIIADIITSSSETCLSHIENMKKRCQ